ncbi:MAG: 2-C-methyl-D-erythritol 2,4-cyclodiphosphate synthase [Elusimicrobiota bacterium]
MRTGIGYDIHRLVKGRKLVLGGIEIDHESGLQGHSDADVVVHSICDAILGAAGLGDIGRHFPDTDDRNKGISSMELLKKVIEKIDKDINNVDVTVICEKPELASYIKDMQENIAKTIGVPVYDVNIKATTNEGLGSIGKGEAIASISVVTIIPSPKY